MPHTLADVHLPEDYTPRERELFILLAGHAACVSAFVERIERELPEARSIEGHSLRKRFRLVVDQWIQEHPEVPLSIQRKLLQFHEDMLEAVDS